MAVCLSTSPHLDPRPQASHDPPPLTWAAVAFGSVAAPQEVEGVVVVEASGAGAARKVATATGMALILQTPWAGQRREVRLSMRG